MTAALVPLKGVHSKGATNSAVFTHAILFSLTISLFPPLLFALLKVPQAKPSTVAAAAAASHRHSRPWGK
jgi:hypothetical protein